MTASVRRLRAFTLSLAGALGLATLPIYAWKIGYKDGYSDFDVYYRAARNAAAGDWAGVYAFHAGADTPFRYGPPFLMAFRPLAGLDFTASRLAWFFLQYLFFGAGFFFLHRAITRLRNRPEAPAGLDPLWITSIALLFSLRFCLDCFTIGQVTSVMFLGFCVALDAWLARRPALFGGALFVPSIIKVAPAFLYLWCLLERRPGRVRAFASAAVAFAVCAGLVCAWTGGADVALRLWTDWISVVRHDASYFDASHYGSQSVKSALLRIAQRGWIGQELALTLTTGATVAGTTAIAAVWGLRPAASARGQALGFSLGVMAYLWFMPETFKYSLPLLAIPVAILLTGKLGRLEWSALGFGALTLSLAGLDIVGETVFFGLQKASVPFLALLALGAAVIRQLSQETKTGSRPA